MLEYAVGTPIYTIQMQSTLIGIAGAGANIGAYIRVAGTSSLLLLILILLLLLVFVCF